MKKITLINYTLNYGGTERFVSNMANFLSDKDYLVYLILLDSSHSKYLITGHVQILKPNINRPKNKLLKIFYFLGLFFYLRNKIKTIDPDIVINTAFPAFVLAAIGNIKQIHISIRCNPENTTMIEGFKMPLIIRKFFYKRAKSIIAQTAFASHYLKNQFRHPNIHIIPNFLDRFHYNNVKRERQILFVGRLIESKGVDYLINAFVQINIKEWKLIIVGDGPERKKLEELALYSNCSNNIIFTGMQSNVAFFYQSSEIFAFPTFSEGFPNVLLEAMATPLACISFDCKAGPSDIITNNVNGFLVETGNVTEFKCKLHELMTDSYKREAFKKEAIKVRSKYTPDKIVPLYLNLSSE